MKKCSENNKTFNIVEILRGSDQVKKSMRYAMSSGYWVVAHKDSFGSNAKIGVTQALNAIN